MWPVREHQMTSSPNWAALYAICTSARIGLASRNTSIESSYNRVKLHIKSELYYHNTGLQLIDQSMVSFCQDLIKSRASSWLGKRSTFLNGAWDNRREYL